MKSWQGNKVFLRCLLFCFFGGIGCLFPFLPLHMKKVGLTQHESYIVSIVAPLVAAIGPLLVCPLADRFGGRKERSFRIMLAIVILLSAISYPLLLTIPHTFEGRKEDPGIKFVCDTEGAYILQGCCEERACYDWPETNVGSYELKNCKYSCESFNRPLIGEEYTTITPPVHDDIVPGEVTLNPYNNEDPEMSKDADEDEKNENDDYDSDLVIKKTRKRDITLPDNDTLMHICTRNGKNSTECHIYTRDSDVISVNSSLLRIDKNSDQCETWCKYTVTGNFSCRIPRVSGHTCKVTCGFSFPSSAEGEILKSECESGNGQYTFWSYLVIRSIADIFPTTAVGLLDAAIIIATRETNLGRGDVGRELAFGSLGFAAFAPIMGILNIYIPSGTPYVFSFVTFFLLMSMSAIILLFTNSVPLSRPEWWTKHARVMPLGGLKRHLSELICFVCILVILGSLWSGIDSYLPWHLSELGSTDLLLGLTLTVGSLPAVLFLWNSERVVEYCGHTNLLIIAFIFYIVRYAAYSYMQAVWWALACEALEVFTMSILWATVLLYMRQLVPQHLTVTSQGMAVFFHFCLGRCLGAVFAALISTFTSRGGLSLVRVYQVGAVVSAVVASLYFTIYHCCLKCFYQPVGSPNTQDHQEVHQGATSNGTYAPLRVYHNGSGQKEQISS